MRRFLLLFLFLGLGGALTGCDSGDADDDGGVLGVGDSVTGTLTSDDPVCDNSRRCDRYTLEVNETRDVTISLSSDDFDTYLYLYRGDDRVALDDDGGSGLNSEIEERLTAGLYEIRASQFSSNDLGDYLLEVE